jgi:hypothetical protein
MFLVVDKGGVQPVGVYRRYGRDGDPADLARGAITDQLNLLGVAAGILDLAGKKAG